MECCTAVILNNLGLNMKRNLIISLFLVSIMSAALGWFAHDLASIEKITPAESISNAWQSQVEALTDVNGSARSAENVTSSSEIMLSSLSMGLALHYDQLSTDRKQELAPLIQRAKVIKVSSKDVQSLAVISCIEEAGTDKPIDSECVKTSIASR